VSTRSGFYPTRCGATRLRNSREVIVLVFFQNFGRETIHSHRSQLRDSQWRCASQELWRNVRQRPRSGSARTGLLVTTTVYLQKDAMALTLNGTTMWPQAKTLEKLGETRMRGTPAQIRQLFERISDALSQTSADIQSYVKDHPAFETIGEGMRKEWEKGRQHSLTLACI
jgi:hypothetical protein